MDACEYIIAKGHGSTAEKIIAAAEEAGIPVYEDKDSAEILSQYGLGCEIPEHMYEVIAQILVFIGYVDSKNEKQNKKAEIPEETYLDE